MPNQASTYNKQLLNTLLAVKNGDFSARMPSDFIGTPGKIADTLNHIIESNERLAKELERVSRAVGREGKISQRISISGTRGAWEEMVTSTNALIGDLLWPTSEMTRVIGAIAKGDLSQTMRLEVDGQALKGEFLRSGKLVNSMIAQLGTFTSEVTRVAREVGTEGKLGGQAQVKGVGGVWKDLTDNVNSMANNLTAQVRNISEVTIAVANGDLSKKITVDVRGEILLLKEAINTMVDQLRSFASEVTRVAREVGTEGKLGGQAIVPGVAGTWKDLTDNVNSMAGNLTAQVRNIAEVTTAVARGDLSRKITVDVKGEILELKNTINTMVDQLNGFASEVTRVAREVGTEGRLGGQAQVTGVAGTWKDLTDNVNLMANNLTAQVRNIAQVTTAVARGDLSRKITVDVKGEILELKNTINTMVDQLNGFASEVTRVAREVGTEGRLGGQAQVKGVAGTWKDLTDNVNLMANNLTGQVRNIAEVASAIAAGNLSKKITVNVRGEILELKDTVNTMVDQLSSFASEVTRVAREVGTEGRLGGQAQVAGVAGTWKDLTDSVNSMAGNLTAQVRNISEVTIAVANGDLSKKITVDVRGEILLLKDAINTMVDQLRSFASEVTRVAREVGTEGKLGGQAQVAGTAGTWKDLTDSVNLMASNLTAQVRNIAAVTIAVANGDLSKKITVDARGEILQLKETINTMVDQLNAFASEVTRVAREVGSEGKLGVQAQVTGVAGTWKDLTDNVNLMAGNLTAQVRNIAAVTTAVASGDLSKKITVDVKGEILELKNTINTMVDQLNAFAAEVTRVAREVGTEGKLGGQAQVKGVGGTWKDLTDNVNIMATNLTDQVRGIAKVVTAVAKGNLKQKLALQAKGEIAALSDTINDMTDTLALFADQVTGVAREVGVDGRLGGQANVPGATGTWKDLVDNVNQLAANLTTQVRAIANVATAVTQGDLTRSVVIDARGEVAELKDNVNAMIVTLRDTTRRNTEQDWLKTNLAKFTRMLQGQRDLVTVARALMSDLSPLVSAPHSAFYFMQDENGVQQLKLLAGYGVEMLENQITTWRVGQGLVGQCALEKQRILLTDVPSDYIQITSGLGQAKPISIVVLPILFEGEVKAVIELASFANFSPNHLTFLEQLMESLGIMINTIEAGVRTEGLLKQSQSLTQELQQTNEELAEKARQLAEQNTEVERKNKEVEQARGELEEKATQLALTSKYKSEFLANMSHELRTPLNSLLILSQQLSENLEGNLTAKQINYAKTIHGAGNDLLYLINDILDLAKIESGTVTASLEEVMFRQIFEDIERTFRHVAESRRLEFGVMLNTDLPVGFMSDPQRLLQVLKNLLSNAFKFTSSGRVDLTISLATGGWNPSIETLNQASKVVAFAVSDTGIGIPLDKQKLIFEAFQQADGSTSRKYGGTGLGLSISREIAKLLGGELSLVSEPDIGSTFTLYLPLVKVKESGVITKSPMLTNRVERPELLTVMDSEIIDDRDNITAMDKVVIIVEDDIRFASVMLETAHSQGFKGVITTRGEEAIELAYHYRPAAITLDAKLPDLNGWDVLERLKADALTREIPVHIVSGAEIKPDGDKYGAVAYLQKPVTAEALQQVFTNIKSAGDTKLKKLLVVEDSEIEREHLIRTLGGSDIELTAVGSGEEALKLLAEQKFDCMVLDLKLPGLTGWEVLGKIENDPGLHATPVVIHTAKDLTDREKSKLARFNRSVIIKGERSAQQLLAETTTFLKRIASDMPSPQREIVENLIETDASLANKVVLIADDDPRNIFALAGLLERHKMKIITAENGALAVQAVQQNPDIDIVLMDIMMPEMDGYTALREIRKHKQYHDLPMIAITAKAMKGDREKCLEAGASDYVTKPINTEQLLRLMRIWLFKLEDTPTLETSSPEARN